MDCSSRFKVLMFPWLASGHTIPLLELAKKLSHTHLFDIYICSTPANLNSIKNKITEDYALTIHLLELHLPTDELPPHCHATNCISSRLQPTLKRALKKAKPDFSNLLKTLQPHLVISDFTLPWVRSIASLHKIPAVAFSIFPAVAYSHFMLLAMHPGAEFPFPATRLTDYEIFSMSAALKDYNDNADDDDGGGDNNDDGWTVLMNSSRVIEGKYMDYFCELMKGFKITPTGALVQDPDIGVVDRDNDELFEWLGRQCSSSSVLVAFGTEYFLKSEEIEEIAHGLDMSNVNFIWVIRAPKGEEVDIQDCLPLGFLERVRGRGKIVQRLVPQAKILKHSSIGGFVSHCGWNSVLESIEFGVPIIGMPMHLDQPMNAKLGVELGVAMEVLRNGDGRLQRDEISKVIKDVVGGRRGEAMKRRIEEVRESVRSRSKEEMDGVVQMFTQLCGKREGDVLSGIA